MVKDLLGRCIIVEEFTDEKVDTAVLQYLNSKCQIAQSKTEENLSEIDTGCIRWKR